MIIGTFLPVALHVNESGAAGSKTVNWNYVPLCHLAGMLFAPSNLLLDKDFFSLLGMASSDGYLGNQILRTCCKTQDGVWPSPNCRHARGRPPTTTWILQICRDTGIPVTAALELPEDGLFLWQITVAGCYSWMLCILIMMMMIMISYWC